MTDEDRLQIDVVEYLKAQYPRILFSSVWEGSDSR